MEESGDSKSYARLDRERNERDRRAGRGQGYDGRQRKVVYRSAHVKIVRMSDGFGLCEVCGDPAAMMTDDGRFCGMACFKTRGKK